MATSGVVTFRPNRDQIITQALIQVGAIDPENSSQSPTAIQITNSSMILNSLVKQWETEGLELWETRYGVVFPQKGQWVYALGLPGPGGDHATETTALGVGGFLQTTLSSAGAALGSTVILTTLSSASSAGVSVFTVASTYAIGIQLDTGYIHWTTVNGAPSGNTVTLTAALPSTACSGNTVYCYQTKMTRPLRVTNVQLGAISPTSSTVPLTPLSRADYNRMANKATEGTPTQFYFDPQRNTGYLYFYQALGQVTRPLYVEYQRPIEDFLTATDDYDLPQEWAMALIYNLALFLAPSYTVPQSQFKQIQFLADQCYEQICGWDQEVTSFRIQPNPNGQA